MKYEITYILKPELTNDEQETVNKTVVSHIESLGGTAHQAERTFSVERGGTDENNLRKFAYPIKKYRQGFYYTNTFDLDGDSIEKLEKLLKREQSILRFLIVNDFEPLPSIEEVREQESEEEQSTNDN